MPIPELLYTYTIDFNVTMQDLSTPGFPRIHNDVKAKSMPYRKGGAPC
jgi:hypothetical protein